MTEGFRSEMTALATKAIGKSVDILRNGEDKKYKWMMLIKDIIDYIDASERNEWHNRAETGRFRKSMEAVAPKAIRGNIEDAIFYLENEGRTCINAHYLDDLREKIKYAKGFGISLADIENGKKRVEGIMAVFREEIMQSVRKKVKEERISAYEIKDIFTWISLAKEFILDAKVIQEFKSEIKNLAKEAVRTVIDNASEAIENKNMSIELLNDARECIALAAEMGTRKKGDKALRDSMMYGEANFMGENRGWHLKTLDGFEDENKTFFARTPVGFSGQKEGMDHRAAEVEEAYGNSDAALKKIKEIALERLERGGRYTEDCRVFHVQAEFSSGHCNFGTKVNGACAVFAYCWGKDMYEPSEGKCEWYRGKLSITGHEYGFEIHRGSFLLVKEGDSIFIYRYDKYLTEEEKIMVSYEENGVTKTKKIEVSSIVGLPMVSLSEQETRSIYKGVGSSSS